MQRFSLLPAVTNKIVELLTTQSVLLSGVQIIDGSPDSLGTFENECLLIGDCSASTNWSTVGTAARDEDAQIDWVLFVGTPSLSSSEARDRAFNLLAEVELIFRTVNGSRSQSAITLGGLVHWLEILWESGEHGQSSWGNGYKIVGKFAYKGRI